MHYTTLKFIHVSAVAISGSGFAARGLGAWKGAAWVRSRAARTLPHLVDTVLLLSALGMLWTIRLSPWALPWLRAKIIGLVFYIGFGAVALRRLRGQSAGEGVALAAWLIALLIFGYIVSVALTKNPLGVFSL
ncbi:MAG TPA: SirB2 family protein [Steroidobacteraceae bacterium]|jgi:uncharacterized membrane protein SirB2|nr:SirB2 family protein [Steroidobacteraceae bacterium]